VRCTSRDHSPWARGPSCRLFSAWTLRTPPSGRRAIAICIWPLRPLPPCPPCPALGCWVGAPVGGGMAAQWQPSGSPPCLSCASSLVLGPICKPHASRIGTIDHPQPSSTILNHPRTFAKHDPVRLYHLEPLASSLYRTVQGARCKVPGPACHWPLPLATGHSSPPKYSASLEF